MDDGVIKEFDDPRTLLGQSNSIFHGLAKDAGMA